VGTSLASQRKLSLRKKKVKQNRWDHSSSRRRRRSRPRNQHDHPSWVQLVVVMLGHHKERSKYSKGYHDIHIHSSQLSLPLVMWILVVLVEARDSQPQAKEV
jgi:hypothetical protein